MITSTCILQHESSLQTCITVNHSYLLGIPFGSSMTMILLGEDVILNRNCVICTIMHEIRMEIASRDSWSMCKLNQSEEKCLLFAETVGTRQSAFTYLKLHSSVILNTFLSWAHYVHFYIAALCIKDSMGDEWAYSIFVSGRKPYRFWTLLGWSSTIMTPVVADTFL